MQGETEIQSLIKKSAEATAVPQFLQEEAHLSFSCLMGTLSGENNAFKVFISNKFT